MPNPLGGGTAIAPNCGFEGGAAVAGPMVWGTRDYSPTNTRMAGVKTLHNGMWVRNDIFWNWMEPSFSGNGPYTWTKIDNIMSIRNNCKMMFILKGGPNGNNAYPGDANLTAYGNMCAAMLRRYDAPALGAIEFYNEPDLAGWTGTQAGNVAVAAANAMAPINAAKAPSARTFSIAGCWSGGANIQTPSQRIIDFYNTINPIQAKIDFVSYHPYHRQVRPEITSGASSPTPHPRGMQFQMADVIAAAKAHGYNGNFAATEFGFPTMPLTFVNYVSEANQARYTMRQMIMMLAHGAGKFKLLTQFHMWGDNTPNEEEGGDGIVRCATDIDDAGNKPGAGTLKPCYHAYQTLMNIIDETYVSATPITVPDPTTSAAFVYRYDKTGGKYGFAFWTSLPGSTNTVQLTGLPASVRKTLQNGAQSTVSTTSGNISVSATNDVTYVDAVW